MTFFIPSCIIHSKIYSDISSQTNFLFMICLCFLPLLQTYLSFYIYSVFPIGNMEFGLFFFFLIQSVHLWLLFMLFIFIVIIYMVSLKSFHLIIYFIFVLSIFVHLLHLLPSFGLITYFCDLMLFPIFAY